MGLILRMNLSQAQQEMLSRLHTLYEDREAATITDWVMEKITGWKKLDRIIHKNMPLAAEGLQLFRQYTRELLDHRPVQYVLQEAWFAGLKFYVDESVLIPRPETEELVEWVTEEAKGGGYSILDVGTGSGCIAITLSKRLLATHIYACDVSQGALAVADQNADTLDAAIGLIRTDFLDRSQWAALPHVHWLVSNPPYIPLKERNAMAAHVVGAEPALALFVPDDDALIFYRALGEFAGQQMGPGAILFAEVHEGLGGEVRDLLLALGAAEVILRKDLQGKDRMIKAVW